MKNYIVSIFIFFSSSVALLLGQSYTNEIIEMDKKMWVSVNPFMFLLGGYGGAIGFFRDNGDVEIAVPVYSLTIDESSVIFGADSLLSAGERFYFLSVGAKGRKYKQDNARGRGMYIGGKYNWSYISATRVGNIFGDDGLPTTAEEKVSISVNTFGVEVGFRSITQIGFTIAPRVGYDFTMARAESRSDASEFETDFFDSFSGGGSTLGLEIGWAF